MMAGLEVSEKSPFLTVSRERSRDERSCCVICVGSTGSGKSSTISIVTGQQLYENLFDSGAAAWLDTVGWEDRKKDDSDTFREILSYIHQRKMAEVLAVIWCVTPQVRTDASLRRQAKFINRMKEGDIWNNVIIVVKQSVNPKYDARGALAAMADFAADSNIKVIGYRFITDLAFSDIQREVIRKNSEVREVMNVLTESEIRDIISDRINSIPRPVKIIFSDSVCIDCGEEGDVRLMGEFCHMEPILIHTSTPSMCHPDRETRYHPTDRICKIHPEDVSVGRCGRSCGCGPCAKPRYSCCGRKETTEGCRQVLVCCRNIPSSNGCQKKYMCCGMLVDGSVKGCTSIYPCCGKEQSEEGCYTVCKRCGGVWGTRAQDCYRKEHNTKSLK